MHFPLSSHHFITAGKFALPIGKVDGLFIIHLIGHNVRLASQFLLQVRLEAN